MTPEELNQIFTKSDKALAELAIAQAKTDVQMAKTDAQISASKIETDRILKDLSDTVKSIGKQLGGMAANQGDVAEEFFFNSLLDKPEIGGVRYDRVQANTLAGTKGAQKEFDIVLVNGSSVALIEVKYKAHMADLEQAESQIGFYRELFPEHRGYAIYSGIAAMSIPHEVADEARKRGLFVLKQVGDVVEVDSAEMRAF